MQIYTSLKRKELIEKILSVEYDLAVIGGGITGAGIALDAASRGLKTVLIEKNDFASGTSSKSTKLIHGGLRYLKQFEIGLVMGVGRERRIVHRLAPHLVLAEKMLLPFFRGGTFGKFSTSLGLWVYDFLAGVKKEDRRKMLSKKKTLELEPLLPHQTLLGSGLYAEYRTDDARLTIEVMKTAIDHGADCINYLEADEFIYTDNKISGLKIHDVLTGEPYEILSKITVSATGPWVDDLRERNHSKQGKTLHLTKGVHIVVDRDKLPVKHSIYFDVPDGRMIFAIPRENTTYIGTTDTDYFDHKDHVTTNLKDAEYLVKAVNQAFPTVQLTIDDIRSSWAGLRPLINQPGKKTSEISRKDELFFSDTELISIAGGKLTGYRIMSRKVTDRVCKVLKSEYNIASGRCRTKFLKLSGNQFRNSREVRAYVDKVSDQLKGYGMGAAEAGYLVHNYGIQAEEILSNMKSQAGNDFRYNLLMAELRFCIDHEMAVSVADFLVRRTGRLFFNISSVKQYAEPVLNAMARILGWDHARIQEERNRLESEVFDATHFD